MAAFKVAIEIFAFEPERITQLKFLSCPPTTQVRTNTRVRGFSQRGRRWARAGIRPRENVAGRQRARFAKRVNPFASFT